MSRPEIDHLRQRLDHVDSKYQGRGSAYAREVRELVYALRERLKAIEVDWDEEVATQKQKWEVDLAAREDVYNRSLERERAKLEESRQEVAALRRERILDEKRSKLGDDVQVRFNRPSSGGWQLSNLEEIAYRLRLAGGVDETLVDISTHGVESLVPDPNLVSLDLTRPPSAPEVAAPKARRSRIPESIPPAIWAIALVMIAIMITAWVL